MSARTLNSSTLALTIGVFANSWLFPCGAAAQSSTVTVTVIADSPVNAPAFLLDLAGKTVSLASGESTARVNVPDDQFHFLVPETDGYRLISANCRRAPGGENVLIQTYPNDRNIYIKTGANADISCTLSYKERKNRQIISRADGSAHTNGSAPVYRSASTATNDAACCSCDVIGGSLLDTSRIADNDASPCDFQVPASWNVVVGNNGANVSVVASPP